MKIRDIAGGIVAGYATRVFQLAASFLLVPFLVRNDVLGVAGYGEVFTLISFGSVFTLLTDGLRVSFSRSISVAIDKNSGAARDLLGSSLKIIFAGGLGFVGLSALLASPILTTMGIASNAPMQQALILACLVSLFETGPYGFECLLVARGRIVFLNCLRSIEVITRTGLYLFVLSHFESSVRAYLAVSLLTTALRQAALSLYVRRRWPTDIAGMIHAPLSVAWSTARYSLAVSGSSFSFYLLNRFTIILASRFLGPLETGYVALVLNTLDRYVTEILFSVVRPILVPIAARLDISSLSTSARRWLYQADASYSSLMLVSIFGFMTLLPIGIPLWLGAGYTTVAFPMQLMLIGTAARLSTSARQSMLIAFGYADRIAIVSAVALLPVAVGISIGVLAFDSWVAIIIGIAAYYVLSSTIGISSEFEEVLSPPTAHRLGGAPRHGLLLCAMTMVSLAAGKLLQNLASRGDWLLAAGLFLGSIGLQMMITDRLSVRLKDAIETFRKLRSDSSRDFAVIPNVSKVPPGEIPG